MEHEPGPRGSPHERQGVIAEAELSFVTPNREICCCNFLLRHSGQVALSLPRTIASNRCEHFSQMYSKMGIQATPLELKSRHYYRRCRYSFQQ